MAMAVVGMVGAATETVGAEGAIVVVAVDKDEETADVGAATERAEAMWVTMAMEDTVGRAGKLLHPLLIHARYDTANITQVFSTVSNT